MKTDANIVKDGRPGAWARLQRCHMASGRAGGDAADAEVAATPAAASAAREIEACPNSPKRPRIPTPFVAPAVDHSTARRCQREARRRGRPALDAGGSGWLGVARMARIINLCVPSPA